MKSLLLILMMFASLAVRTAMAYDYGAQPQSFSVKTVYQAPLGCLPDTMIHITCDTNQFVVRLLANHRMFTDYAAHSLNLSRVDSVDKLSFRILAAPDNASLHDPSTYRQWIYDAHPGVQILQEYTAYASGMRGPAFAIQWRRQDGLLESEQVAYIPSDAGILEFSATSLVDYADAASTDLKLFLLAFRAATDGKLEMPVRHDQS